MLIISPQSPLGQPHRNAHSSTSSPINIRWPHSARTCLSSEFILKSKPPPPLPLHLISLTQSIEDSLLSFTCLQALLCESFSLLYNHKGFTRRTIGTPSLDSYDVDGVMWLREDKGVESYIDRKSEMTQHYASLCDEVRLRPQTSKLSWINALLKTIVTDLWLCNQPTWFLHDGVWNQ